MIQIPKHKKVMATPNFEKRIIFSPNIWRAFNYTFQ